MFVTNGALACVPFHRGYQITGSFVVWVVKWYPKGTKSPVIWYPGIKSPVKWYPWVPFMHRGYQITVTPPQWKCMEPRFGRLCVEDYIEAQTKQCCKKSIVLLLPVSSCSSTASLLPLVFSTEQLTNSRLNTFDRLSCQPTSVGGWA